MAQEIRTGLSHKVRDAVTAANTAKAMGSGCLEVFATPAMCCMLVVKDGIGPENLVAHMQRNLVGKQ